ncbi:MAG: DoxX family protein [Sphingobacteriaceae bacterium]|nr:DoxX family protein [Sphingobacteriaceae bacterium]
MNRSINENLGKLILRVISSALMLFHGTHKGFGSGLNFVKEVLDKKGLPEFLAYGVPVAEIIAPLFIILGVFTRISSGLIVFTMIITIYLVLGLGAFQLGEYGNLSGETNILYLTCAVVILLTGPGKYSLYKGNNNLVI